VIAGNHAGIELSGRSRTNLDHKGYRTAAWVGIALLALAIIAAIVMGKWWGVLMLAAFLIASIAFVAFEDRLPALFDLLFVAAALVNALGWVFNLYTRVPGYDEIAHGFTMFAITLSFGFLAYHPVRTLFQTRAALYVLALASFGLAVGALWEMIEWAFIGTLRDPVADLYMDAIGALAAGLLALWVLRYEPDQRGSDAPVR
jgi:hypothetical protein